MKRMSGFGRSLFILGLVGAGAAGLGALSTGEAKGTVKCCNCPFVELWVVCSDGNYYMNECWAAEAGATGCVPVLPPPPGDPES